MDPSDSADDDRRCDMTLEEEPDVEAGGTWAMSVYKLPEDEDSGVSFGLKSAAAAGSSTMSSTDIHAAEGTGAGGTTDVTQALGPVASGKRAFTVVNECSSTIRVGSTGGR